jgi:hypothetical protein
MCVDGRLSVGNGSPNRRMHRPEDQLVRAETTAAAGDAQGRWADLIQFGALRSGDGLAGT